MHASDRCSANKRQFRKSIDPTACGQPWGWMQQVKKKSIHRQPSPRSNAAQRHVLTVCISSQRMHHGAQQVTAFIDNSCLTFTAG